MIPTRRKRLLCCVIGATLLLSLVTSSEALGQSSPSFILEDPTLAGGGGGGASSNFSLRSNIGQAEPIGEPKSNSFALVSGSINEVSTHLADIDITPGSTPNCIKATSKGRVAIAVLGESVNVQLILSETVRVADKYPTAGGLAPVRWSRDKDVSGDGSPDLVAHFVVSDLASKGLLVDGGKLYLSGSLSTGGVFFGSDTVYLAGGPFCSD